MTLPPLVNLSVKQYGNAKELSGAICIEISSADLGWFWSLNYDHLRLSDTQTSLLYSLAEECQQLRPPNSSISAQLDELIQDLHDIEETQAEIKTNNGGISNSSKKKRWSWTSRRIACYEHDKYYCRDDADSGSVRCWSNCLQCQKQTKRYNIKFVWLSIKNTRLKYLVAKSVSLEGYISLLGRVLYCASLTKFFIEPAVSRVIEIDNEHNSDYKHLENDHCDAIFSSSSLLFEEFLARYARITK